MVLHSPVKQKRKSILKKNTVYLTAFVSVFSLLLLIFCPGDSLAGAKTGLILCAEIMIPTLFPFMVFATLIAESGVLQKFDNCLNRLMRKIFRLPGAAVSCMIIGLFTSYPVGAKYISRLYVKGQISKQEAERLLCFCVNAGPAFIISAVGAGMLKNIQAGLILFALQVLSCLLLAFFSRFTAPKKTETAPILLQAPGISPSFSQTFVTSVKESCVSILNICAFVVLFSAFSSILVHTGVIYYISSFCSILFGSATMHTAIFESMLFGFLEVTSGCVQSAFTEGFAVFPLLAFCLGFGGICVHLQVLSCISDTDLSAKKFIFSRFFGAGLSTLLAIILFTIFPQVILTANMLPSATTFAFHSAPACIALVFLAGVLILSDAKKIKF